jgi:hypothetical protein
MPLMSMIFKNNTRLQTSSGSGEGTLRGGLTVVGAEMSSNGDRVPGDAALVGHPQGGPTIW